MKPRKIGRSAVKATEAPGCSAEAAPLRERYSASDLAVLSADELARFVGDGPADPRENAMLAWELLYRLEPELYDRLVQAERLHPAILECCVAGIPDRYRGETVKAYVVLRPGAHVTDEELDVFCRERLAAFKVPRIYAYRDSLPKSAVGKVLRRLLIGEDT